MATTLVTNDGAEALVTTPRRHVEVVVALIGFGLFATLILTKSPLLLEPDDFAYRASIAALGRGQILLSNAQYLALNHQLSGAGGTGILQWHHLASGEWISEKNPGYPFFAVVFYVLGWLRVTPLFYGALACVGLFHGARAWLGRGAGACVVWLYCFSGAALVFAWRATMPTFSDASLIAAGFGGLVWTIVRVDADARQRSLVGLASFLAIEGAVFIRYTNVVELIVALVTVTVLVLRRSSGLSARMVATWFASAVALGALVIGFDEWAYGHATSTGYAAGEITFSLSSLWPNVKGMPERLFTSMPMWSFAAIATIWMAWRALGARRRPQSIEVGDDTRVASMLVAGWAAIWLLYLTYSWTAGQLATSSVAPQGAGPGAGALDVHVIRFYLPALGLVALLATWLLMRMPRLLKGSVVAGLVVASLFSFAALSSGHGGPGRGGAPDSSGGGAYGPTWTPPPPPGLVSRSRGPSVPRPPSTNRPIPTKG